ncbi:MAG: phage holin [Firmicutes bacterium]|nr:phage holin [Bacillota bacterium]
MKLSDTSYDTLKWVITLVLPALATLVQTIGESLSWEPTSLVVTILTAVTTFLGAVFMSSSVQHQRNHVTISKKAE